MAIKTKLLKHQEEEANKIHNKSYWALLFECGTGKTLTTLAIIDKRKERFPSYKTLYVCPNTLIDNVVEEVALHTDMTCVTLRGSIAQRKAKMRMKADIYLINYEAMRIVQEDLINQNYDLVVFDECFHAGTLVDTISGSKEIQDIRVGDLVKNALGYSRVTHIHTKVLDSYYKIVYDGNVVSCSQNHLWLTTEGWVPAYALREGHLLITSDKVHEIMRGMREEVLCCTNKQIFKNGVQCRTESFLREILLREVENETAGSISGNTQSFSTCQDQGKYKEILGKYNTRVSQIQGYSDASIVSPTRRSTSCKDQSYIKKNALVSYSTWRERNRCYITREILTQASRNFVEDAVYTAYKNKENGRISWALQNRFSSTRAKDSCRNRRFFTSSLGKEETRHEEDKVLGTARVDSVTFHKSTGIRIHGTDFRDDTFYDLSVEGHPSFTVNGVLVHNSQNLKGHGTMQSKASFRVAMSCPHRLILTGTPLHNGPLDAYGQYRVLSPDIFGTSYFRFRARYAFMGGFLNKQVLKYINMAEYKAKILKCSSIKLKHEVLDLPPRTYETIKLELPDEQKRMYKQLKEEFLTVNNDAIVTAPVVITRLIRFSQITAGFYKDITGKETSYEKNPKQDWLVEWLKDHQYKTVVFVRFIKELKDLGERLRREGIHYVSMYGETKNRIEVVNEFNNTPGCQVFIGQIDTAGAGINLQSASYCVFLSNSYSYGDREQAESRIHRQGQLSDNCTYLDLVYASTIDESVLKILKRKESLAGMLKPDILKVI